MNKFYNSWITIVCISSIPIALAIGLNEDFTIFGYTIEGEEFAYGDLAFAIAGGIVLVLGGFKAVRKWMGLRLVTQTEKFSFITSISKERKQRVRLYNTIEILFLVLWGGLFFYLSSASWSLAFVLFLIATEHLLNSLVGLNGNKFRIGVTKKAILRVDREVDVVYFKGLQKITVQQQSIIFEYINGLVLHLPLDAIPDDQLKEFEKEIKEKINPERVYYSGLSVKQ